MPRRRPPRRQPQQQPEHQHHRRDSDSGGGAGALCPTEPAVPEPRVRHRHSLGSGGRGSATTMNCLVLLPRAAHPGRAGDTVWGPRRRRRAPSSFGSIFSSTFSSSSSTFSSCIPPSPAADPGRRSPDPGCRGAREGWWHRRTHFWRTSSDAPVVRRVAVPNTPRLSCPRARPPSSPSRPSPSGGGGCRQPYLVASVTSRT